MSYTTLYDHFIEKPSNSSAMIVIQFDRIVQGAAERTPQFGRVIASGGERIQW